jgi:hypothetical protein
MAEAGSSMLMKDDGEHPVPEQWRSTFGQVVDAFVAGDFQLSGHPIAGVVPIDPDKAQSIADNILAYGDPLAPLNEETWDRSAYRWMDGYWQVLVDLTTAGEPVSDLALHAKIYEAGESRFEITSVHVP